MDEIGGNLQVSVLLKEKLSIIVSSNVEAVNNRVTLEKLASMTRIDRKAGSGTQKETQVYLDEIEASLKSIPFNERFYNEYKK